MNILIVKLSALGDVVHTLPSLVELRRLYPDSHITWVIEEAAADLIKGHPCLDAVLVSRRKSWIKDIKRGKIGVLKEIRDFIAALRSRPYDLVIDFHGLLKSSLIVALSGGKRKLGFDSMQELSGLFLTEKIPEDMGKHALRRYLDFIGYLRRAERGREAGEGEGVSEPEYMIPIGEAEEERINALLEAKGIAGRRFAAVNPVALWETKLWSDEGFARLCDLLQGERSLPVVLTGTDRESIGRIQALMKTPALSLAGETTLKELACLYRRAAFVVSTDSGPMHIAAAVGTPVVALFGPTDPARTGPFGKGHRVVRRGLPCSPCFLKKCATGDCMRLITVEEVLGAIDCRVG